MAHSPILPISVIIPCGVDLHKLEPLLNLLELSTVWPAEVLIIDSFQQLHGQIPCSQIFANRISVIRPSSHLYPGSARNLGCQAANMQWLVFLDHSTLPSPGWLEAVWDKAQKNPGIELFQGFTCYRGDTWQKNLFITATYGESPLSTLPGSLVHSSVMARVGGFLPNVRAGEDTDWLLRVKHFAIPRLHTPPVPLLHLTIPGSLHALAAKWYRNYSSCSDTVSHLESQKLLYLLSFNFFIVILSLNWNSVVAQWQESSAYYLPNLAKVCTSSLLLLYFAVRGLLMPLRRGSQLATLLPFRWVMVSSVCFVLDAAKLLAFLSPNTRVPSSFVTTARNHVPLIR